MCSDGNLVLDRGTALGTHKILLFPQNLLHWPPLCQFVDEFVQVADFPHERFIDVLNAYATYDPGHKRAEGIEVGCLGKKRLKVAVICKCFSKLLIGIPGEPADDGVDFLLGAALSLYLGNVERVHAGKAGGVDAVGHGGIV